MCGIVGYTGPKNLVKVLLDGLTSLEYRGYDSAGLALFAEGSTRILKRAGKLGALKSFVDRQELPVYENSYGIGHTRWATHGPPNEPNAHPHQDCTGKVILVHNGIIENYAELRDQLAKEGHRFTSDTDTEVVAHLIEREMRDEGFLVGVQRAVDQLQGAFALVCASPEEPGTIVGVRNGPPLIVGFGDGEGFVASDIPALIAHTREIYPLGDEEIAVVSRDTQRVIGFDGSAVEVAPQTVTWDVEAAQKGGYPHFMLKEIMEQPEALRETLLSLAPGRERVALPGSDELLGRLDRVDRAVVVACGTSWHAALIGKSYLEQVARIPSATDIGSEYRYGSPVVDERTLVVFVTQSGETADTLAALREARRLGATTLAITNVEGSMVTREAHAALITRAGPEVGVASTKTFTCQVLALYLLALGLAHRRGVKKDLHRELEEAFTIPHLVQSALHMMERPAGRAPIAELAKSFSGARDFLFLGRGLTYPIALEGALKLKEISYIHAEGYPSGEMKHGPIALIDEAMPVVALIPSGPLREKMLGNVEEVKARAGQVIAVSEEGDHEVERTAAHVIEVPRVPTLLSPLVFSIPMQLFAYHVAEVRGCDVDQPRNLAKSVTVE